MNNLTWQNTLCYKYLSQTKPVVCPDATFQTCRVLFREKTLSPATLPNKSYLFSLSLTAQSWTLTFDMLTEVWRVWDVALVFWGFFCGFSEHYAVWPWGELAGPLSGKICSCLKCFPLVNNLSLCRVGLMGSNNCFSDIIPDVFPSALC